MNDLQQKYFTQYLLIIMKHDSSQQLGKSRMMVGYYQIHVLIDQSSALCLNKNQDIDAMISVQAFDKIQYSKILKKVGYQTKNWGEHFYFSKIFKVQEFDALQKSLIIIKAWDYKKLLKDALIGQYQLSVQRIYSQNNHTLTHTWLALSNITKNFGEVAGYIKASINVIGQNDQAVTLEQQPASTNSRDRKVLLPSNIQRKSHQLTVDIYQGKSLNPVDGQSVDAYIGVEFGMIYSRTETVVESCQPVWNETVEIPVHLPAHVDNIILRLIDANVFKSKQVLGTCFINLNQLISELDARSIFAIQQPKPNDKRLDKKRWVNFYGPQTQSMQNKYKHQYSMYPQLAPAYVGSVLLQAVLEPKSNPKKQHSKHPVIHQNRHAHHHFHNEEEEKLKQKVVAQPLRFYRVQALFELGTNLPPKFESFGMELRIGKFSSRTKLKKVKKGFVVWDTQKDFTIHFYENQDVPDIFFYLFNENQDRICFFRAKPDFELGIPNKWRKLKPDLTKITAYGEEAGYVKFGLQISKQGQNKNFKTEADLEPSEQASLYYSQVSMKDPCKIVIDLYCAQGLLAGDDDGSTDPCFKFSFQQSIEYSTVKRSTRNPIYIERFILNGFIGEQNQIMPMTVSVYNKKKSKEEAIGTCYIDLENQFKQHRIQMNTNFNNIPQWHDIQIDNVKYGKFLAGITIIKDKRLKPTKDIVFFQEDLQTYQIYLLVLGLRSLKSSNSLISIRKPIIYLDFDSLHAYSAKEINRDEDQNAQNKLQQVRQQLPKNPQNAAQPFNIKVEPNCPGSSVNIKTVIHLSLKLPHNKLLWPMLSAKVSNSVISDLFEPHIGYFSINLKEAYIRTKKMRQQFELQAKSIDMQNLNKPLKQQHKLSLIDKNLVNSLTVFVVRAINYNWQEASKSIKQKLNKLRPEKADKVQKGQKIPRSLNQNYIVVMPKYTYLDDKQIYREDFKQIFLQNKQYIKVGYDNKDSLKSKTKQHRNRHYRYCLDRRYEDYFKEVKGVELGIYQQIPIKKGKVFLPDEKNQLMNTFFTQQDMEVGFYKGNCSIIQKQLLVDPTYEEFIKAGKQQLDSYMKSQKVRMYLYIINATSIPSKQAGTLPEPYLIVKIGEQTINVRIPLSKFSQKNSNKTADPQFNIQVQKDLEFPDHSEVIIQLWDRGFIKADQFIGQAFIYAQNRVFAQLGKMKFNNPVETHPLKAKTSRQQQGKIRFWVDFVPVQYISLYREFDISSSACPDYQVRIIVWGVSEVLASQHDITDMVDLYVTVCFNGQVKQTDIHYRSESGQGSFNWRMIFPVKLPMIDSTVTFKVYDKSLLSKDSYLAVGDKNIGAYLQEAYENQISVKLFEGLVDMKSDSNLPCQSSKDKTGTLIRYDIFDVSLRNKKGQNDSGDVEAAKVMISVEVLPKEEAEKKKAGEGRGDPNEYPNLPDPTGRLQFSMNPATMLSRLCGKKFKNKILMVVICFFAATMFWYFWPSLTGSLLAAVL